MEIVEIWQNLEKNATQVMIFLPHYMRAEINKFKEIPGVLLLISQRKIVPLKNIEIQSIYG